LLALRVQHLSEDTFAKKGYPSPIKNLAPPQKIAVFMHATMANADEASAQQQAYQAWLESNHVFVRTDLVETTNENVVAGWGCVATANIKKGTVLFRIPRAACFAVAASSTNQDKSDCNDDDPTTRDSQRSLALHYLHHKSNGQWSPFLNLLTPQMLPWTLHDELLKCLIGTELELVVHRKLARLQSEYEDLLSSLANDGKASNIMSVSYGDYLDACSIVASHANPWFGVSIVPFNTTLNWGSEVNVEFDLESRNDANGDEEESSSGSGKASTKANSEALAAEEEVIVGRAICNIKKGSELFQSYGDSTAELLYRCGFAPNFNGADISNSISFFVGEIVRVVDGLLDSDGASSATTAECDDKLQANLPSSSAITDIESKIEALKKSGAIDSSSWDGMEDCLTAELSSPSPEFINTSAINRETSSKVVFGKKRKRGQDDQMNDEDRVKYDDGGVSKLIGTCLVLLSDTESWQRASKAIENLPDHAAQEQNDDEDSRSGDSESNDEDDEESRTDDIAASVLLSSLANMTPRQSTHLQQIALDVGTGGHDPWRALLIQVYNSKALKWDMAIRAAKLVIEKKMTRLNTGEDVYKSFIKENSDKEKDVMGAIQVLRDVERSLLTRALNVLDIPWYK
jgi:hypothetical protein